VLPIWKNTGSNIAACISGLATQLVQIPVGVIMAQGAAVSVVNRLNLPVPVVFASSGDPVSAGFAQSLARPGRNLTGVTFMAAELNGKRLELMRDFIPDLRRVAIVANPEHPGEHLERDYSETTGRRLGMDVDYYPTRSTGELAAAFAKMAANKPQAISLFADGFAIQNRESIINFGLSHKVPVISGWPVFAESGAICTYGPRLTESYRRMASYVDRILKGEKPSDLPIEQPTQFQLGINLRTAKALGITVPPFAAHPRRQSDRITLAMSAIGPQRTSLVAPHMSAADIGQYRVKMMYPNCHSGGDFRWIAEQPLMQSVI
jgi:putative tryptophan/tyrosine transport system substrate-binding protein